MSAERGVAQSLTPSSAAAPAQLPVPPVVPRACPPAQPSAPAARPTVVVWYRADLRMHDHPALMHALEEAAVIVPVYCFDPRQFGKTQFGFEKTGCQRAKFLVEAVGDLRESLQKTGADLVVRQGRPEDVLPVVCHAVGASSVFYHREVTSLEREVEESMNDVLRTVGMEAKPFWANTLYEPEDLPFDFEDMPEVYTEFREAAQQQGTVRAPLPAPEALPSLRSCVNRSGLALGTVPTLHELGLTEPDAGMHRMHASRGGKVEALSRLDAYIAESRAVPDGRSVAVHLGADFSCKISPWLALGCLSPRRIHADLAARAAKSGQTSTYFELMWRDYFRFITHKYRQQQRRQQQQPVVAAAAAAPAAGVGRASASDCGHAVRGSMRMRGPARGRAGGALLI